MKKILVLLIALIFVMQSCKKEEDPGTPPQIPPTSTFVMNFNDFDSNKKSVDNWGFAATNVVFWNIVITINAIVPVAAYYESFKHEAVYDTDNGDWVWSYNFKVLGITHTAALHAKILSNGVDWKMYISRAGIGGFSDFLWYEGFCDWNRTQGDWTLYRNPDTATAYIGIDWHRNSNGTSDIKYTNIIPGNPENGGYIMYGVTKDTLYNRFYDIYNKGKDNLTNILWNYTTKEGRIKDSLHFGDVNWHCWNDSLQDDTCY